MASHEDLTGPLLCLADVHAWLATPEGAGWLSSPEGQTHRRRAVARRRRARVGRVAGAIRRERGTDRRGES